MRENGLALGEAKSTVYSPPRNEEVLIGSSGKCDCSTKPPYQLANTINMRQRKRDEREKEGEREKERECEFICLYSGI